MLQYSQENTCVGVIKIKKFKATLLKRYSNRRCFFVNIAKFSRLPVLKNICEQLLLWAVSLIRSIWSNLAFAHPILVKFLFQNQNIKIISKMVNLKTNKQTNKQKITILIYLLNVYVMFYCKIQWVYQDFKSENLCFLNLYVRHAVRILDLSLEIMLTTPKWGTKHLYNIKGFSVMPEQV